MATAAELAILLRLHDELSTNIARPQAAVEKFGVSLSKVGNIAGGFLAAQGITTGIRGIVTAFDTWIDKANESARVQAQLDAVLKSTNGTAGVSAKEAKDLASSYQLVTRFTDEQVLSAENLLLTFTRIGKDIFPQATETVLNMATALGEDTSSAAIQLGKALQDPILGVTALRRVGVAFTQSQQEQIKALVESGHGMEAQKLILKELETEFGGSAQSLTAWERQWRKVTVAVDEGEEKLGAIVEGGLTKLSTWLGDHQDDISDFIGRFGPTLDAAESQLDTVLGGIIAFWASVGDTVSSGVDFVGDLIHGRWSDAWDDAQGTVVNVGKVLLNNLIAIFGAIPNILISGVEAGVNGVIDLLDNIPKIKTPGLDLGPLGSVGPQTLFGGFDLNHVDIGRINTPQFDVEKKISDGLQAIEKLGNGAEQAGPPVKRLAGDFGDAGDGAQKLADAVKKWQDEMGQAVQALLHGDAIDAASNALFGRPTREQADATVRTDRLQLNFDRLSEKLEPNIERLNEMKDALDGAKDRLDSWGESIDARRQALSDAGDAIDEQIKQVQARGTVIGASGSGGPSQQQKELADSNKQAAVADLQARKDAIDRQNKALDREERLRSQEERNLNNQEKVIGHMQAAAQHQLDAAQRQIDAAGRADKVRDDEHKLAQDRITQANALLISEEMQAAEADKLRQLMADQSTLLRDKLNPGITALYPEINTAKTAFTTVKDLLNNEVSAALLGFAKMLSDFKLPTFTPPKGTSAGSGPDDSFLWQSSGGGP